MALDRLGLRRTIALLTLLPSILAIVLGWSVVVAADERADVAAEREEVANSIIRLGRLRATVVTEIAIYELWSETVDASDLVDATPDLLTPTIRGLVDESFELAETGELAAADDVARLRADLNEVRARRDALDRTLGADLGAVTRRAGGLIAESDQRALLSAGGGSAAMLYFTDFIDALTLEVLTGSQLLFGTIQVGEGAGRLRDLIAAGDAQLALIERADPGVGAELERLVDESAVGTIRAQALALADGRESASLSLELLQASASFADDAAAMTTFGSELAGQVADEARQEREQALDDRNRTVVLVVVTALLTTAALLVVGRRLAQRLDRLSATAARISAGELAQEPIADSGSDGIAIVASSMDDMVDTLTAVQRQLTALAHGRSSDPVFDEQVPGRLGTTLRFTIDRVRAATDRLQTQADTDPLTGTLNRRALERALTDRPTTAAVLVIDLDRFKAVNDEYGHAAGDEVLVTVARRLLSSVRDDDLVGRLGGDEFVVAVGDADAADVVVERIRQSLGQPISTSSGPRTVGASIGVARPDADETLDAVLRRADAAMYDAKRRSRATTDHGAATG